MAIVYGWLPEQPRVPFAPLASVASMVNGKLPVVVGVPERTPVVAFKLSPEGRLPEVTAKVYGAVPPLAVIVWL